MIVQPDLECDVEGESEGLAEPQCDSIFEFTQGVISNYLIPVP